jgi:hypothetical protein
MPKLCRARAPADAAEAAQIRKLAPSHHGPHDCKPRAQMIALSWEGLRTGEIASHLRCHPQTGRERFVFCCRLIPETGSTLGPERLRKFPVKAWESRKVVRRQRATG